MLAVPATGHVGAVTEAALGKAAGAGLFAVLSKPVAPEAVEAQGVTLL